MVNASKKLILFAASKIPWRIKEDFFTPTAAGALNGRKATPGPGIWVGTDTYSKISVIVETGLDFATGEAQYDGGWLDPQARKAGRMLLAKITPSETTNGRPAVGWDTNAAGAIRDRLRFQDTGILDISADGGTVFNVGVYTATPYWILAIMRATGFVWFVKGGVFTYWTRLMSTALGTAAGLPAINAGGTVSVFVAPKIRVPDILWLPRPIISDGFSLAGITDGLGHAEGIATGIGAGGGRRAWSGATWSVAGGYALNTPTLGADMFDAGAGTFESGTYAWTVYGTNTIANVSNTLEVTYVDNAAGAHLEFSNAEDLNANLTIGRWYVVQFDASVNAGSSVIFRSESTELGYNTTITSTTPVTVKHTWCCTNTTLAVLRNNSMGAGEKAYWDNISIKQIDPTTLHQNITAGTANVAVRGQSVGMANPATQVGVSVRLATDRSSGLNLYWDGAGNIKLDEFTATVTYSNLMSVVKAWATNDSVELQVRGTAYRCYHITAAGVITLLGSGTCTVNGSLGTDVGTFSTDSGNTIDNFTCYPTGDENQYGNDLDRFIQ